MVFDFMVLCLGASGEGSLDGGKKSLFIHWFLKIGASAEGAHPVGGAGFIMSGEDDNRHQAMPELEGLQHVEAADSRHVQVQQQAVQWMGVQGREESFAALILLDAEAPGDEQPSKRFPHLRLVIKDCDHWCCHWHRRESLEECDEAPLLYLGIVPGDEGRGASEQTSGGSQHDDWQA